MFLLPSSTWESLFFFVPFGDPIVIRPHVKSIKKGRPNLQNPHVRRNTSTKMAAPTPTKRRLARNWPKLRILNPYTCAIFRSSGPSWLGTWDPGRIRDSVRAQLEALIEMSGADVAVHCPAYPVQRVNPLWYPPLGPRPSLVSLPSSNQSFCYPNTIP